MIHRILHHARERLEFVGEVPQAERVQACKRFLGLEGELIHRRHKSGESGLRVAHARSAVMDVILGRLFDYALATHERSLGPVPMPVSLVALGGYGRGELCPQSDIDFMFLFPPKSRDARLEKVQKTLSDEILYVLWDLGLKVGHSTRTVDQAFEEAEKDMQSKTALLDVRLVAGSGTLFDTFQKAYRNHYRNEEVDAYIDFRLKDQESRRQKYGNTVFLQEPDVKNGVGGLRDFHSTLWMARVKLGVEHLEELVEQKYLLEKERREFAAGYDFLLRVRNDLHFNSKHPTDLLTLDLQPALAERLGYTERDELRRVELFMRDYYRHAQNIFRTSQLLEKRLALARAPEAIRLSFRDVILSRRHTRLKKLDGFVLRDRELSAERKDVFMEDPRRLLRVFRHCQQLEAQPDFELHNLIRASLPLLTNRILLAPDANLCFRTILESPGQVFPILSLMHELGVLGKFIPEFGRMTCLVQHEYYHRYTADIHTLNTIRELDLVFLNAEEIHTKYGQELRETTNPALLYAVLFLHDIGKAKSIKGHDEIGMRMARPILERLQYDPKSIELAQFLIRNHLVMARFWQKYDVDDPQTATAFSEVVGDSEKLRLLYVHTFCDARGTASSLWNSYKDTLHGSLFRACKERLTLGNAVELRNLERKDMLLSEMKARAATLAERGVGNDEVEAHFSLLPDRYFVHAAPDEILLHIRMVNRLVQQIATVDSLGSLLPVIEWQDDLNRSITLVHVVTWDRAGLFYRLAGAFSVAGLNILGARINTRNDHIAIDTFLVAEPGKGVVQNEKARVLFQKAIESALLHNKDLLPEIQSQAKRLRSSLLFSSEKTLPHTFNPHVDVYHELSLKRTILEVQAQDQIGLLYQLSRTIFDHGFDITFARINTERNMAVDTFYIEPANRLETKSTADLLTLRESIAEVILPPAS